MCFNLYDEPWPYGNINYHPDDETLAAFVDDALSDPECIRVNDHLNYCPRCYELVSETRAVLQMAQSQ